MEAVNRFIALAILIAWPIIPIYWLPLRLTPGLSRRLGRGLHLLQAMLWLFVVGIIWHLRQTLLDHSLQIAPPVQFAGWLLFCAGLVLQTWTAIVLGRRITGIPEIEKTKFALELKAPFNLCRHPTYLAHLCIFGGAAFATGFPSLFILSGADFLITRLVIIPLEEKELEKRFGDGYRLYKREVPCFFPKFWYKKGQQ